MIGLFLVLSCAPKMETTIAHIEFKGNGHPFALTNDQNLRSAMTQKELAWLDSWRNPDFVIPFDSGELQLDAWRVENWYAQQGFINAQVTGWSVQELPDRIWNRHHRLKITGFVEEGEQVHVRSIRWSRESYNLLQRELDSKLGLSVGDPLNWQTIEYAKTDLLQLAQNRSYAYANVEIDVDVWPTNCHQLQSDVGMCLVEQTRAMCEIKDNEICSDLENEVTKCKSDLCLQKLAPSEVEYFDSEKTAVADIHIQFREGPSCKFGEVQWLSETTIPQSVLEEQTPFGEGDIFRLSQLSQFQRRLFALNQFAVVTVTPLLTGGTDIPVHVTLAERKKREAQIGVGGNVDSGFIAAYTSFDFSHINIANRLLTLDWENQVGYAIYASLDSSSVRFGPTLLHNARIYYPRFIKSSWAIGLEAEYELGVQPAFRSSSATIAPYWSWKQPINNRLFSALDAQLSYYFTGFEYLDAQVAGLEDGVRLGYIGQQVILDGRNDPMHPKQGHYWSMNTYQASSWLGGEYSYWKAQTEIRRFFPIINLGDFRMIGSSKNLRQWKYQRGKKPILIDGVFSYRLSVGGLLPYSSGSSNDYAPNAEYFFLGGGSDVRGWRQQYLGPYVCVKEPCVLGDNTEIIPIGGKIMGFGTVEYRQYFPSDIGFATFMDFGMVWSDVELVQFQDLQPSVGLGLRYVSPIGPVRLDGACRLKNDPRFVMEDRCRIHFAFSESY